MQAWPPFLCLYACLPYLAAIRSGLTRFACSRPDGQALISASFFHSLLSSLTFLPYLAILHPWRCDFPMQRYSVRPDVKYRLANRLVDGSGSLPQIKDFPSAPRRATLSGVGIPLSPRPFTCLTRPFPAACPACKISPDKEAGRASKEGKQNNVQLIKN